MTDQEAISFLLRENGRLARQISRWRVEARRQRDRAEYWRHRALAKAKR